jgi:hypothetical protein
MEHRANSWIFLLAGILIGSLVTGAFAFGLRSKPAARVVVAPQPLRAPARLYKITPDETIEVRQDFRRCRVTRVTISKPKPEYDVDGNVSGHNFWTTVDLESNRSTPTGPRITVTLWDATKTRSSDHPFIHNEWATLEPGKSDTVAEPSVEEFVPAYFSVWEHD